MLLHQMGHWEIIKSSCETHEFCHMQLEIPTYVSIHLAEILKPKNSLLPLTVTVTVTVLAT